MSRPPLGPALIDKLEGSADAKRRARLVVETLAGLVSVEDAAQQLDVSPQRFHVLRDDLLSSMIAQAEPKPVGRPPSTSSEDERLEQARQEGAAAERAKVQSEWAIATRAGELREQLQALGIARPRRVKRGR
jgi:hypothetical protein